MTDQPNVPTQTQSLDVPQSSSASVENRLGTLELAVKDLRMAVMELATTVKQLGDDL